jgi:hypothetical protein
MVFATCRVYNHHRIDPPRSCGLASTFFSSTGTTFATGVSPSVSSTFAHERQQLLEACLVYVNRFRQPGTVSNSSSQLLYHGGKTLVRLHTCKVVLIVNYGKKGWDEEQKIGGLTSSAL